ncbi:MAG: C-GCAxxG-C-C family (seleno)protein [Eubacterium sp.]
MINYVDVYNAYGSDQPDNLREQYHMNCAEVLLRTGNAEYDLGLDEKAFKMMQGFGGGFYSGYTCGAFSGALAAISARYAEDRPSKQEKAQKAAKLFVEEFIKEFGSLNCTAIKEQHRDEKTGCDPVKVRAADVMKRVVNQMDAED